MRSYVTGISPYAQAKQVRGGQPVLGVRDSPVSAA